MEIIINRLLIGYLKNRKIICDRNTIVTFKLQTIVPLREGVQIPFSCEVDPVNPRPGIYDLGACAPGGRGIVFRGHDALRDVYIYTYIIPVSIKRSREAVAAKRWGVKGYLKTRKTPRDYDRKKQRKPLKPGGEARQNDANISRRCVIIGLLHVLFSHDVIYNYDTSADLGEAAAVGTYSNELRFGCFWFFSAAAARRGEMMNFFKITIPIFFRSAAS